MPPAWGPGENREHCPLPLSRHPSGSPQRPGRKEAILLASCISRLFPTTSSDSLQRHPFGFTSEPGAPVGGLRPVFIKAVDGRIGEHTHQGSQAALPTAQAHFSLPPPASFFPFLLSSFPASLPFWPSTLLCALWPCCPWLPALRKPVRNPKKGEREAYREGVFIFLLLFFIV